MKWFVFLALVALGTSCAPKAPATSFYALPTEALLALGQEGVLAGGLWPEVSWWTKFNDDQLNSLINKALDDNPDVHIALARIRQASYEAKRAKSPLFPSVNFDANVTWYRTSKTGALASSETTPLPGTLAPPGLIFSQTELNINATYQLDLWQETLNRLRAADHRVLAAHAEAFVASLMISSLLAETYFHLQTSYHKEALAHERIANRKELFALREQRFAIGLDDQIRVWQAQEEVTTAQETLARVQQDIAMLRHQISALVAGAFDETIVPTSLLTLPEPELPETLPLDLVARRADVMAALWHTEEKAYLVKAAKAAFYPNVNLLGLFGYQSLELSSLFEWQSSYAHGGPALHLPLFEGGLLQANAGLAQEAYFVAVETYNKTLLEAIRSVLSHYAGLTYTSQSLEDFRVVHRLSLDQCTLVQMQAEHDLADRLQVLQAQLDTLDRQVSVAEAVDSYLQQYIDFIGALGGGYDGTF